MNMYQERKVLSHPLTFKVLVVTIDAQWEGLGDVGSVRYEPALRINEHVSSEEGLEPSLKYITLLHVLLNDCAQMSEESECYLNISGPD